MTLALFQRAAQSLLSLLGEGALFRGAVVKINLEKDVEFDGVDGEGAGNRGYATVRRDVATVPFELAPKGKETFQFVDAAGLPTGPVYRLEKRIEDSGMNPRFIVIALP